jgi:hypothetical protein
VSLFLAEQLTVWKSVQLQNTRSVIGLRSFNVVTQRYQFVLLYGVQNIEIVGSCKLGLQFVVVRSTTLSMLTGMTSFCSLRFVSTNAIVRDAKMLTIKLSTWAKLNLRESYDFATIGIHSIDSFISSEWSLMQNLVSGFKQIRHLRITWCQEFCWHNKFIAVPKPDWTKA